MKKGVLRMFETKRKRSNRKVGKISYWKTAYTKPFAT
jgi:hypothetical protein